MVPDESRVTKQHYKSIYKVVVRTNMKRKNCYQKILY